MQTKSQSQQLVGTFETLIREHHERLKCHSSQTGRQAQLADFIAGFVGAQSRHDIVAHENLPVVTTMLDGYLANRGRWAEQQKLSADDFNLFEVMEVEHDEVRHSMILAWLLDSRLEHGTHAQGNLCFRLFLEEFERELQLDRSIANTPYWVRREVSCSESRVDIEIAAGRKFIIHIENKLRSAEGGSQTEREWRGLRERVEELEIPTANAHGIFLTRDGSAPENKDFHPVRWSRIARILDKFAQKAEAPEVRLFSAHYAKAVRKFALTEPKGKEITNGETTV